MQLIPMLTGSFHSAATYREARKSGDPLIGYALFVVVLCSVAVILFYTAIVQREVFMSRNGQTPLFDSVVTQIVAQLPVMTFKDGTLATKDPVPSTIKISGQAFGETFTDVEFITIDTTGLTTHENMKTPIVITAKEMLIKSDKETKIKQLSEFTKDAPPTMLINHAVAEDAGNQLIKAVHNNLLTFYLIVDVIAFVFLAIFFFIMRLFMLLALGLVGISIGSMIKDELKFSTVLGLAALSYTPIAILDTALLLGFGYSPHIITLFLAGSVTLFAAIRCSKLPPATPTSPAPFA